MCSSASDAGNGFSVAKSSKGKTFPAETLQRQEVLALLDACSGEHRARNRALITVLWRAGLRLGEALALRPHDIDHSAQTIRVLHGKGDKARTVGIDKKSLEIIDEWLEEDRSASSNTLLFHTRNGTPIQQAWVRQWLPRLAKKAGVRRRVHAHMFRHSFAVELVRENVPMPMIQALLGHASLNTTSIYLASLSPEEALNAVRGRTW